MEVWLDHNFWHLVGVGWDVFGFNIILDYTNTFFAMKDKLL